MPPGGGAHARPARDARDDRPRAWSTIASASSSTSSSRMRPRSLTPTTLASLASPGATGTGSDACPPTRRRVREGAGRVVRGVGEGARGVGLRRVPPSLERIVELRRAVIECFAPYDDAVRRLSSTTTRPGCARPRFASVFAVLEPEISALVAEHADRRGDEFMRGPFPIPPQEALSRELIEAFGATWDAFRLDSPSIRSRPRSGSATSA